MIKTNIMNLTREQSLISIDAGLDGLPGYVLAVFETLNGRGARFVKLIDSGERFRRFGLRGSPKKYFSIAVNQSVLRYSFEEPVILDDDVRQFKLTFHLTYKASDARVVAELSGKDPLRRLRDEMTRAISRSCAQRKWAMITERFRELEQVVLNSERDRLRAYAATLGIEIISIELDRHLPETARQIDFSRMKADENKQRFQIDPEVAPRQNTVLRARDHQLRKEDIEEKYALQAKELEQKLALRDIVNAVHQTEQHRKLRDATNAVIGDAITNVARDISTPADLMEAFAAAPEIPRTLETGDGLRGSGDRTLLGPRTNIELLGAGEDRPAALVTDVLREFETDPTPNDVDVIQRSGGDAENRGVSDESPSFLDEGGVDQTTRQAVNREIWNGGTANLLGRLNAAGSDAQTIALLRSALAQIGDAVFPVDNGGDGSSGATETIDQPGEAVTCTVFAPPKTSPGRDFMVQVFAHLKADKPLVRNLAVESDNQAKRLATKQLDEVQSGSELTFHLSLPGLVIDNPVEKVTWHGEPEHVQFGVHVPAEFAKQEIVGTVYISEASVPFGHVKFLIRIASDGDFAPSNAKSASLQTFKRYEHAFISYASSDRSEVLKRVQMLSRFHIDFFQDLLTLEPGQRWEKEIYRSIDRSDVFFLFWSSAARNSEWVMREIRYALQRKGTDEFAAPEIVPVIIEGPPAVPPPDELSAVHFNDAYIYLINATADSR